MMDCSKTEVFFAEWNRMCGEMECPLLEKYITDGCEYCERNVRENAGESIKIVQEWSNAHQPKTRLSEFLEKYPKAKLYGASELPRFCVADLYGTTWEEMGMVGVGCADCWNTPMEQGVQ